MNKKRINWVIYIASASAFIGLLILIYFFILTGAAGLLFGEKINLDVANKIGSFIGGLVGSFWTLTGVLLYYSVIKAQKSESTKAETRHAEQIDLLNLQKFQQSFTGLFNLYISKKDEISNSARTEIGLLVYAFDNITNMAKEFADEYNNQWDKSLPLKPSHLYFFHDSYKEKLNEFSELFILIMEEIYKYKDFNKVADYERMLLNVLTYKQITTLILCAVLDLDNSSRLKNCLFRSEYWETRCMIILNQDPTISIFWTRYRSTFKEQYP